MQGMISTVQQMAYFLAAFFFAFFAAFSARSRSSSAFVASVAFFALLFGGGGISASVLASLAFFVFFALAAGGGVDAGAGEGAAEADADLGVSAFFATLPSFVFAVFSFFFFGGEDSSIEPTEDSRFKLTRFMPRSTSRVPKPAGRLNVRSSACRQILF